ncbi:ABC transporter permease [Gammaproteobacteria bacterium]|nr:ABC transporter permease [Gammaproteobacteria bacterium]
MNQPVFDTRLHQQRSLISDFRQGTVHFRVMVRLAYMAVIKRYRRTRLGPLWVVLNTLLFSLSVGSLFAYFSQRSASEFIVYMFLGYTFWLYISESLTSAFSGFRRQFDVMSQRYFPLSSYIVKFSMERIIVLLHSMPLVVVVALIFGGGLTGVGLFLVGWIVVAFTLFVYSFLFAFIGARVLDAEFLSQNFVRIMFFATPIIWHEDAISPDDVRHNVLIWNPAYHALKILRDPLLQQTTSITSILVVLGLGLVGLVALWFIFDRFKDRVYYWIS